MKQTTEAMPSHLVTLVVILFACVVCPLEGRVCTRVRAEEGVKTVQYPGECPNSFEAYCGWFSFEKCIVNETIPCVKTRNVTVKVYRIVEECCPGYQRNRDRKCVPHSGRGRTGESSDQQQQGRPTEGFPDSGFKDTVTGGSAPVDSESDSSRGGSGHDRSHDDDDDDGFFLGISHGAYAGIICGILFVACVALLTAMHYRKRRLQEEKKVTVPADQEAAQRQQMIPMEKLDSPAAVTT